MSVKVIHTYQLCSPFLGLDFGGLFILLLEMSVESLLCSLDVIIQNFLSNYVSSLHKMLNIY